MGINIPQNSPPAQLPLPHPNRAVTKKSPANKPTAARDSKKKTRKKPMEVFGFDDTRQALLCAPAKHIDCANFVKDFYFLKDGESGIFQLTVDGQIRGFEGKTLLYSVFGEPRTDKSGASTPHFPMMSAVPRNLIYRGKRVEVDVSDECGNQAIIGSFGGAWAWLETKPGQKLHVVGSSKLYGTRRYFNIEEKVPEHVIGHIWTKYRNMASLVNSSRVEMMVTAAKLDESSWRHCCAKIVGECAMDELSILKKIEAPFESLSALLHGLHEPKNLAEGQAALECARRISALAMQASALMQTARNPHPKAPIAIDFTAVERMKSSQKEKLTKDQVTVVDRICTMMCNPKAFSGLLSGDVGTGKTLAYLIPAIAAHQAGAQVAIMAPTTLLADQLFGQLQSRFANEIRGAQRIEAGNTIKEPGNILIGTAGLVSAAKKSSWLPNLLICDEQHKMSNATRESLVASWTHVLNVSATPIPRSLATALYEGMEILNLRQSPVVKEIHSHVTDMTEKTAILSTIREAMSNGERCAIVYPAVRPKPAEDADGIEDVDALPPDEVTHTVESAFASFNKVFPGKVVMLHGQMDDVRPNIERMRSGSAQLMIASTVIETGIDIPSVSVMVVRNADCFGISQLHQLRGRLVRNGGVGDFIMAVENLDEISDATRNRLDAIASTTDGYELAERDLLQRGMGDFSGAAQSGTSQTVFRMVKLDVTDFMDRKLKSVYVEAKKDAVMPNQAQPPNDRNLTNRQNDFFG